MAYISKRGRAKDLMVMLLLSYHTILRLISQALELRVEGRRVSHSWCMCVVSHGNGGMGGGRDGGWYARGTKPGVGHMSRDAGSLPECEVIK